MPAQGFSLPLQNSANLERFLETENAKQLKSVTLKDEKCNDNNWKILNNGKLDESEEVADENPQKINVFVFRE